MPESAPPEGSGRLVVDVVGDQALVSRVVETSTLVPDANHPEWNVHHGHAVAGPALEVRRTELLCQTPCVLDLRQGAHTLVFTSTQDETRTSSANVIVSSKPGAVRHALGKQKPAAASYITGMALMLLGGGLTAIGGLATGVGLAIPNPNDATGRTKGDSTIFLPFGLVTLGLGLASGTTGIVLVTKDRPEHQPGSTTQWALP